MSASLAAGCRLLAAPRYEGLSALRPGLIRQRGLPLVELTAPALRARELLVKGAIDLAGAAVGLVLLSAVFAFALFIIGTFAEDLRTFAAMAHGISRWLAIGVAHLIPNFAALNVISSVAHGQPVAGMLIAYNTAYALLYAAAAVCGASLIFEHRNLK